MMFSIGYWASLFSINPICAKPLFSFNNGDLSLGTPSLIHKSITTMCFSEMVSLGFPAIITYPSVFYGLFQQ